jgi:uncharacterized surface protein with fasciclin (FAS1) repeats
MKLFSAIILLIVSFTLIISEGCKKKAYDEFYGRPDTLAQPIYQTLQAKGNFKNLLACIDKAGYKDILSAAGSWTLFAPNDAAFTAYFTSSGIANIDAMDSATAQKIVTFSLVYNAFTKARLSDYQSTTGWVTNNAFRRRTTNYTGFYNDTIKSTSQPVVAIASNRNNSFVFGDNNNKYITYFTSNYFAAKGLNASDYNFFYPSVTFTGFNVANAAAVNTDIFAENGYIHEIDKVVAPPKSIDQYLGSSSSYSVFKNIFDKYLVNFVLNADATNRYKLLTGKTDNVYVKQFTGVSFSPNNENFIKAQDNDGQSNNYSLLAPQNNAATDYINSVILENYPSLDGLPPQIIYDFVNAQMWPAVLWPSRFAITSNSMGEPPTINIATNVVEKQVLSNGFFYGTNKVNEPNVFRTVYGRSYLDPKYLLMTRALDINYRYVITIPSIKYTVVMMSDQVLKMRGYDYSTTLSAWTYTQPGTTTVTSGNVPRDNLQRILAMHIVPTPNGELDNLSGSGIIETVNGEYIKWNNGKFSSAGTLDSNYVVNNTGTKPLSVNGKIYYADNLLTFSVKTVGTSIVALGGTSTANSEFYNFVQYLKGATIYNATTGDILGVQPGVFYTSFVPNNNAIVQAVKDGVLPGTPATGVPNFAPTTQSDKDLVNNFILYHILNKTTVVPDGKKIGTYEMVYKKLSGDPGQVIISGAANSMQIKDNYGRNANVIVAASNNLANRCVIHLTDNYLKYNPN